MKGVVFTLFLEMVEDKFGFEVVDRLIDNNQLESGGAYTAVGTYDHRELVSLVGSLQQETQLPLDTLLESYGRYLMPTLLKIVPALISQFKNTLDLVASVDSIIHVEVAKLYPEAELPRFEVISRDEKQLQVLYDSSRPFAALARGLILGCSEYFNEPCTTELEERDDGMSLITVRLTENE